MRQTLRPSIPVTGNVTAGRYSTLHAGDRDANLRKALGKARDTGKSKNTPDLLKGVVTTSDIATTVIGATVAGSHAGQAGGGVDVLNAFYKATKTPDLPVNPFLEGTTYDKRSSPRTLDYLRQRARKGVGGQALGLVGSAVSGKTARHQYGCFGNPRGIDYRQYRQSYYYGCEYRGLG